MVAQITQSVNIVNHMRKNNIRVNVIGAGLAGCEVSNFLANHGIKVDLYEKRPLAISPAHHTDLFGELVCSNSLKSRKLDNACGLLKKEMEELGSLMIEASKVSEVKGGDSLNVDREVFSTYITKKIKENKNIEIHYEDVNDFKEGINIICTGPLTSKPLLDKIQETVNDKIYGFFDASAPIVDKSTIDLSNAKYGSRYENDNDDVYINLPFTKDQFDKFYEELINAKRAPLHDFDVNYFEGCLPIEVIASRGYKTLLHGPLKPVGFDFETEPYAVCQLRKDDLIGNLYNIVGFQTNLTYQEQKRVFSLIPGLENAKFVRYGLMHRNSYIYAPKILNDFSMVKTKKDVYIAGQLSGVEGYVESAASGLLVGYYCLANILCLDIKPLSFNTVLGSLIRYITHTGINNFSPMNANFGIMFGANSLKKEALVERSLKHIELFKKQFNEQN